MQDHASDEELLERARLAPDGDMRAFEALVLRHQEKIVANCRYITRSAIDAEDLAQEVFLKMFFSMSRFEGRSTVRTWLQRIKVNHCLNHLKKRSGKTFVDVDDAQGAEHDELSVPATAERDVAALDDRDRITRVLDSLPDTLRVPLILCDMDKLAYQEIADSLGVGLSAVKMRIKRAREEFKRRYGKLTEEATASPAVQA